MNSKGLIIVIISVTGMLYFVVSLVTDFSNASQYRTAQEQAKKDSTLAVQFDSIKVNDSLMQVKIEEQNIRIDDLQSQLVNIKYKLRALAN